MEINATSPLPVSPGLPFDLMHKPNPSAVKLSPRMTPLSPAFLAPFYCPLHPLRTPSRTLLTRRPRLARQTCRSLPVSATLFRKKAEPDRDDPLQHEPPLSDCPPTAFSPALARTSLQALVAYYVQLCRCEPFIARRLALAVLAVIFSKLVGVTVPLLLKRVIDALLAHSGPIRAGELRAIIFTIVLYAVAKVAASVSHELRTSIFSKAGQRIGRSITVASFAHIHSLEAAFHNSSRTGAVTRMIDRGTRSVLIVFRGLVFNFLPSMFELVLVCGVLARSFSITYVVITLLTFVVFISWTLRINNEIGVVRAQMNSAENDASAKLTDSLLNVEAVKSFDNAKFELSRYDTSLEMYEKIAIRNEWIYATLNMGQGAIFTVGLTLNLILAARGVLFGSLTVGSVVLLSTMLQQLWVPLNYLGWQYREVKQSLIDLQNLFEILQRESKIFDAPDAKELQGTGGEIVFENVSFKYPEPDESMDFMKKAPSDSDVLTTNELVSQPMERKLALDGLSLRVPAGKSLALVGSSGSGKSTATRLLYRLYDLTEGTIFIDGQDISKATISSLRQAVSIVPQVRVAGSEQATDIVTTCSVLT